MEQPYSSQFARPRIDIRALFGLYDPADLTDWGPIRAAQVNSGRQLALFLLAANLGALCAVMMVLMPFAPMWQLTCWAALVTTAAVMVVFRRLSSRIRESATLKDVRVTVYDGIALGASWSIAPLLFGPVASSDAILGLWIVLTILMTAGAVAMAGLPMATIGFLGILGAATSTFLYRTAGIEVALAALFFTGLLVIGCFARARALVVMRANELALAERDETVSLLLREFEDKTADWLWETDAARRVIRASPRFAWATGHDPVTINGKPFLQVLAGEAWENGKFGQGLHQLAEKLKGRESFRDLLIPVHVKGDQRWWEIAASPRYDEKGLFLGFRGVGSDVTDARASADKINRMARYDALTGLPNRLMLNENLAAAMADADKWGSRCAFMMIDLDRFKAVNDTLGHPVGDRLLGRVAERLSQLMTANEIAGRLGGDEFAVVIRDATDSVRVDLMAEAIIETLSRPYDVDSHTLYIGASVGVAIGPRDGRTADALVRSADLALYRAKDAGGGAFHAYEPQLHSEAEERRVLEMALRKALTKGELSLNYQPVVAADTGCLTGFEALVRWNSPEFGPVSPAKFVPIAEDTRLIGPIGEWVLRTACAEAAGWASPVRVAVNVSAEQLREPEFVTVVASALAESGLPAGRLEIEVTESVFMEEGAVAIQVLDRIIDLGVKLSLDDFGTGYSSLGYLSRTRFSTIKVDRSFVTMAAQGDRAATAIICAVVALARSLDMATTAEGVETDVEHAMLQKLGCTKVQGYYFGRPLPVEEARAIAGRGWDDMAAA